jgi:hypothetical protein
MLLSTLLSTTHLTTSATIGVDKTFSPEGFVAPGVSRYVDRSGGIAKGFPWFTVSLRPPTKASSVYRLTMKLGVPHLETVTASTASGIVPVAPVAYRDQAICEFLLSDRGTAAERAIFLSLFISTLMATITASDAVPTDPTSSPIPGMIANFDPPY